MAPMKTLLFFRLCWFFLLPSLAMAQVIITDTDEVQALSQKFRDNEIFLKLPLRKIKIYPNEIGKSQTPFYRDLSDSHAKRFYQHKNNCYELTVQDNFNLAYPVKCSDKSQELYLSGYENYRPIKFNDLLKLGHSSFKTPLQSEIFNLKANLIYPDETSPTQPFKVHLSNFKEVKLTKEAFTISQNLILKIDQIDFLKGRAEKYTHVIKPRAGSMLFLSAHGELLLFNPPAPLPFGDYHLTPNTQLRQYLLNLQEQSKFSAVCFRDHYIERSSKYCQGMIFGTFPLESMEKITLIKVDFNQQEINLIR
jgi:hypothetical protein